MKAILNYKFLAYKQEVFTYFANLYTSKVDWCSDILQLFKQFNDLCAIFLILIV